MDTVFVLRSTTATDRMKSTVRLVVAYRSHIYIKF